MNNHSKFRFTMDLKDLLFNNNEFSFKKMDIKIVFEVLEKIRIYNEKFCWQDIFDLKKFHSISNKKIENICPSILNKTKGTKIYQLAVSIPSYKANRVIGYVVQDVFHLVCFDLNHKIFNMS